MSSVMLGTQRGIRTLGDHEAADPLDGAGVTALARAGDTVWAITDGHALMRITPASAELVAETDTTATCLLALDDTVWVGTEEAHLLRLDGTKLQGVSTFDAAPSR